MIDVYKVGVHIGMTTNSSQVLSVMLKELTGINVAAGKVEKSLAGIRTTALGLGAAFVGWEVLKTMTRLTEKGIAFNQELAKMKMANFAPEDIRSLEAQAYKTVGAVPGTNLVDALKGLVDLRNVSGLAEHAVSLSETIAKVNNVLANVSGAPAEAAGFKFIKFLEDSGRMMGADGQFSEARVQREARWMEAVIAATNGRVNGDQLFQLRQSGKASVNSLSDQGITNLIPAIMSLGPVATGTAIQGLSQQLLGSVQLYKHTIDWLEGHGLLDPSKVIKQKGGRYSLLPGAMADEGRLQHDPAGWIWDTFSRHLKHADGSEMSVVEKIDEIKRSGLRVTAQGLLTEAVQNEVTQKKEVGNIERSNKVDQFAVMDQESPTFRITKFTEAWTNLQIALGKTVDVTTFLVPLTHGLDVLSAAAIAHPEIAKDIVDLTAALGGLLLLGGTVRVFSIAMGPFVTGIRMLTGITGLAATGAGLTAVSEGAGSIAAVTGLAGLGAILGTVAVGLGALGAAAYLLPQILKGTADWFNGPNGPLTPGMQNEIAKKRGTGGRGSPNSSGHGHVPLPPAPGQQGSLNAPIVVHVANAGDVGRGMIGALGDGASRPQSGPTWQDYRFDVPSPGLAVG